jgi:hypothetical protein
MATAKFTVSLLQQREGEIEPNLLALTRKSLAEVLAQTSSLDSRARGLALDALAFKLMDLLDMRFVAARPRAETTDGIEIGLIFESDQPVFSRWQVQCKKTEMLTSDDVAKEVGLTYLLKSNVIIMISTGNIEDEARLYADAVMRKTNLCIVMLDGADLHAICVDSMHIRHVFRRESQRAKARRPLEI